AEARHVAVGVSTGRSGHEHQVLDRGFTIRTAPRRRHDPRRVRRRHGNVGRRSRACAGAGIPGGVAQRGPRYARRMDQRDSRASRGTTAAARSAARHSGDLVSVAGVGGAARDSVRRNANLWTNRGGDRPGHGRACGRPRVRDQPGRAGDSLSPRRCRRRPHEWISMGRRAEAGAPGARTAMSARVAALAAPQMGNALRAVDWDAVDADLDAQGFARLPAVLTAAECEALAALYSDESRFRSRIDMQRFRFGVGEYKYFAAPLPETVQALRASLYPRLAAVANRWARALGTPEYPPTLDAFLAICHKAGQRRPPPLLLSYGAGGYNCLHQDIYGDVAFPLQVVIVLSRAGVDYTGGEFLLVEQR